MSRTAEAPSTTSTPAGAGAFEAAARFAFSMSFAMSARKRASSIWAPFRNVLQCLVMAAMPTASPISASVAPFSFANSVCATMQ